MDECLFSETRELPEYILALGKGKSKVTPASSDERMKFEIEGNERSCGPKADVGLPRGGVVCG